jgi:iron(III) transport system substrate-binding protein
MKAITPVRIKPIFLGCVITLFLCSLFFTAPFNNALALSLEAHTAKLVQGAKKEGKMSFYATLNIEHSTILLNGFKKKYPFIKTSLYRTGGLKMVAKIMAEVRAKKYLVDVTVNGGGNAAILQKEGVFAKYHSPHRKFYLEGSKDPEGYWTDIYVNLHMLGYNTRFVSPQEVPKAWTDLTDPKWKGKMGMDTKAFYWFGAMIKHMGEEKGMEYMKKLGDQDIQFRPGKTLLSQLLSAGEMSLVIGIYNTHMELWKSKGGPVDWVAIDPVFPQTHPFGVCSNAPHPNAAKLFVDYVLSKEGQELIANMFRIPTRIDVETAEPKLKRGIKIEPWDTEIANDYPRLRELYWKILMKR